MAFVNRIRAHASAILLACAMLAVTGCSPAAPATDRKPAPSSMRPVVVAIGDSIMRGHGLSAAQAVVASLRAKLPTTTIVGISTVWNHTVAPDQMADINEQVRTALLAVKGTYLDIGQPLAGHRSWLQTDGIHPTARGQQQLATVVAGSIRGAKLSI